MARRGRSGEGPPDKGQLLLLAGFILIMMFVVTSLTLSKISNIEADVAGEHQAPVTDEFDFIRSRLNETMNSLVDTGTTNSSFNETFSSLRGSFSDVENSKGYDLVLELAGSTTPAPQKESGPFVDPDGYQNVSFDGERDLVCKPYDGVNDGIIHAEGFIQGFVAYIYLADNYQRVESTTLFAVNTGSGTESSCDWTEVESGTDVDLEGVVETDGGLWAVGQSGRVLRRSGGSWSVVDSDGPTGNGDNLRGIGVTEDGSDDHVWVVGDSGAVGEYDADTGSFVTDHSGPDDNTGNFYDVSVVGSTGSADVYIATDSGEVLHSSDDGSSWSPSTPGDGSGLRAIEFHSASTGHAADSDGNVFETTDSGSGWTDLGIDGSPATGWIGGIDSDGTGSGDVWVAGEEGKVYEYGGSAGSWTENSVDADENEMNAIDVDGGDGIVVGESGTVAEWDGSSWSEVVTPTGEVLTDGIVNSPDTAVGDSGTIIER
jgi:photosystem II stability/assembly factor-like uncharacterized protein